VQFAHNGFIPKRGGGEGDRDEGPFMGLPSRVPRHNRGMFGLQRLGEIEIGSNLLTLVAFNRHLGTGRNVYLR
jgi:hypothetical protein